MRFIRRYEDNCVLVSHLFLKLVGIKSSFQDIRPYFKEHLYNETIVSLSDFLRESGMNTRIIRAKAENLNQIPTPFIAQVKSDGDESGEFVIVIEVLAGSITLFDNFENRSRIIKKDEFTAIWTGISLISDSSAVLNPDDLKYQELHIHNFLYLAFALVVINILSVLSFSDGHINQSKTFFIQSLNSIGIAISLLLLQVDMGYMNGFTKAFCGNGPDLSCNRVLNSSRAKIFGVKWSTIGLVYFTGNLLLFPLIFYFFPRYISHLFSISILSLVFVLYSFFYQWLILGKWCMMCLGIQVILVLMWLQYLFVTDLDALSYLSASDTAIFFIKITAAYAALLYLIHQIIIPRISKLKDLKFTMKKYKGVLNTRDIFLRLLEEGNGIRQNINAGVFLGDVLAENVILNIYNPLCHHCSSSQIELFRLLKCRPKLLIHTIFLSFEGEKDLSDPVICHFLNLYKSGAKDAFVNAMVYWCSQGQPKYEQLVTRFPLASNTEDFREDILIMSKWCHDNSIVSTPHFYVNGKSLPTIYSIKDLKYVFE
jgi:uncharacterized membrane protein